MGFFSWLKELFKLAVFTAWRWAVRWYRGKPKPEPGRFPRKHQEPRPWVSRDYVPKSWPSPTVPLDNPIYTIRKHNQEYPPDGYARASGIIYGNDFSEPYQSVRAAAKDYPTNGIRYTPKSPYRSRLNRLYDNLGNAVYRRKRKRYV